MGHWGPRLQEGFRRRFYSLDLAWLLEGGRRSQTGSLGWGFMGSSGWWHSVFAHIDRFGEGPTLGYGLE